LIIPGGTTERYVSSLGKGDFYERIRNFVFNGGKYIGICAGAYLAPKECIGLKKGRRIKLKGLGIIDVKCIREHKRRRPGKLRKIKLKRHSLTKGSPQELEIWYHNGPGFIPRKGVEVAAVYENGLAAIVSSKYGKGKVVFFGPHPEGDFKKKINPAKLGTLRLIKNAIDY
jgi:biotin--protein ligase